MIAARKETASGAGVFSYSALVRAGKIEVSNVIVLNRWLANRRDKDGIKEGNSDEHSD